MIKNIKKYLIKNKDKIIRVLFSIIIIISTWKYFLYLIKKPPIDTTSALIMVWISAIILFITFFPDLFKNIKRFKFKNFEIEMKDSINKISGNDLIKYISAENFITGNKRDFNHLVKLIKKALINPNVKFLLVVNINNNISIPMLFIYLFLLDLINPISVVFISSRNNDVTLENIKTDKLIGVISGKEVLQDFFRRFPGFSNIFLSEHIANKLSDNDNPSLLNLKTENLLRIYNRLKDDLTNNKEYLTLENLLSWFTGKLSNHIINIEINNSDLNVLKNAIIYEDEFIILEKQGIINSIVPMCNLTKNISIKIFS